MPGAMGKNPCQTPGPEHILRENAPTSSTTSHPAKIGRHNTVNSTALPLTCYWQREAQLDCCAPSEARRFLLGESPIVIKLSQRSLPSLALKSAKSLNFADGRRVNKTLNTGSRSDRTQNWMAKRLRRSVDREMHRPQGGSTRLKVDIAP